MGHLHPSKWDEATAETIRAERAAAKLSQTAAAERSGLVRGTYIRYETGERVPNIAQVAAIAQGLGVPFSVFMRRIEDRVRSS